MGYSIRNIPNVPSLRAAFSALRRGAYRARGRGCPVGKTWKDVQYGTPIGEAPKFTAYYGSGPYAYFEFVGWQDGKPVVRTLT